LRLGRLARCGFPCPQLREQIIASALGRFPSLELVTLTDPPAFHAVECTRGTQALRRSARQTSFGRCLVAGLVGAGPLLTCDLGPNHDHQHEQEYDSEDGEDQQHGQQ
jgi:hypothetical protein